MYCGVTTPVEGAASHAALRRAVAPHPTLTQERLWPVWPILSLQT